MVLNSSNLSRGSLRPYASEFLGTALLVVIGDGVVAQCLLSDYQYGTWLSINFAWAAAVCLSSYFSDPSPAINPAVTICLAILRPSPRQLRMLPGKLLAQFLGGFVGAAIVYINYRSAINAWDPEYTIPGGSILSPRGHHSAGIFATYPSALLGSNWEAAFSEMLGSAVLMFGCLSISDPRNAVRFHAPQLSMFLLLLAIGASLGWQTGYVCSHLTCAIFMTIEHPIGYQPSQRLWPQSVLCNTLRQRSLHRGQLLLPRPPFRSHCRLRCWGCCLRLYLV